MVNLVGEIKKQPFKEFIFVGKKSYDFQLISTIKCDHLYKTMSFGWKREQVVCYRIKKEEVNIWLAKFHKTFEILSFGQMKPKWSYLKVVCRHNPWKLWDAFTSTQAQVQDKQ